MTSGYAGCCQIRPSVSATVCSASPLHVGHLHLSGMNPQLGQPRLPHQRQPGRPSGHVEDGTVRLWNLTGLTQLRDHVMRRACTLTGGGLTRAEWDRYVEGLPYVDVCTTDVAAVAPFTSLLLAGLRRLMWRVR